MKTTEAPYEWFIWYAKDLARRKQLTLEPEGMKGFYMSHFTLWSNVVPSDEPVYELIYNPKLNEVQVLCRGKVLEKLP